MAEEKTYVFGNEGNSLPLAYALNNGNNGWGLGGWGGALIGFLLGAGFSGGWGGFGGFGGNGAAGMLNNDNNTDVILQAINGTDADVRQLATTFNSDFNTMSAAVNDARMAICLRGHDVMIKQNFYLDDWDWYVTVYYAVDTYYIDDILSELEEIGCTEKKLEEIAESLVKRQYNTGLTYSNLKGRCSVIVIGLTSSPAEFQNTFDHEKGHLAMHICEHDGIDPFSEEYQYLTGEIGQSMFPVAKNFLCVHCRLKLKGGE